MLHIHSINLYYYIFDGVIIVMKLFEAVYAFALKIQICLLSSLFLLTVTKLFGSAVVWPWDRLSV
jgi:hypothetical protein